MNDDEREAGKRRLERVLTRVLADPEFHDSVSSEVDLRGQDLGWFLRLYPASLGRRPEGIQFDPDCLQDCTDGELERRLRGYIVEKVLRDEG